jgi:hypothetical protein
LGNPVSIRENKGDVIGVNIDGSGNIIGKNLVIYYQVNKEFNLSHLTKEYLEEHSNTDDDFSGWLKGFELSLPSIYRQREFRRERVLSDALLHDSYNL